MDMVIRSVSDADGVLTLWLDAPGKPVNTCSSQMFDELAAILDGIERQPPVGVIITSGKARSFNAGADLPDLRRMTAEAKAAYLAKGQVVFQRLAALRIPTVAAINGDALGGGFELALACKWRLAADPTWISIGLPEVKLGLLPAWGGTTRLPRLLGLGGALPILLAGKTMSPAKALNSGLVDAVAPAVGLLEAAKQMVLEAGVRGEVPPDIHWSTALSAARQETLDRNFGHATAAIKLLDVVATGFEAGIEAGLRAETAGILWLMEGAESQNLLRVFFLRPGEKKRLAAQLPVAGRVVDRAAVVGGGTMGSGIVHAMLKAGIGTLLVEVDAGAVSAATGRVRAMLDQDVRDGRIDEGGATQAMGRLSTTTEWHGLEAVDLVVEAAFEEIGAKHQVFSRLQKLCKPNAVLATNTSSLRVSDIGRVVADGSRLVGLHFFNPVPKMPLVEVVRTSRSGPEALSTVAALAAKLGKVPVLVGDEPGFVVNRLLIPYLAEALLLAEEGGSVAAVDHAMKSWGMPMGPFELMDEIGLDITLSLFASGAAAGGRGATPKAMNAAVQKTWLGRKSGRGFYEHSAGGGRSGKGRIAQVNEELAGMFALPGVRGGAGSGHAEDAIQWRLILPMINQAAGALRERVVDAADTIDLAMTLGAGTPGFRGGLTHFADATGLPAVVARMKALEASHGRRFAPDALLTEWAAGGGGFAGYVPPKG